MDTTAMDCYTVGIEAFPLAVVPPPPPPKTIPDKILAILKKYKYNWRLAQLSKPMRVTPKYVSEEEGLIKFEKPKVVKLDPETLFYSDQLAVPALKNLIHNKMMYSKISRPLRRRFKKNLKKAWTSIYNFYKNKERQKKLKHLKKQKALQKTQAKPKTFERVAELAKHKKTFEPPRPTKRPKVLSNYARLDTLASPKVCIIQPPKRVGVNPRALTYEPTEIVLNLAKLPKRFEKLIKPLQPGAVRRAALRYKITPRTESLAVPKTTREKAKDDDDFDPWTISKNALKYKATPRMLELAKPKGE